MIYYLTEEEKRNRSYLQIMRTLIKLDPDRYDATQEKTKDFYIFKLIDKDNNTTYEVKIRNKSNNFPWKWKFNRYGGC